MCPLTLFILDAELFLENNEDPDEMLSIIWKVHLKKILNSGIILQTNSPMDMNNVVKKVSMIRK